MNFKSENTCKKIFFLVLSVGALAAWPISAVQATMPGAPRVATVGTNVYIAWADLTPLGFDVFLRRSMDGGATFDPPINISHNLGSAYEVALAADGNRIVLAWTDDGLMHSQK